MELVSILHLAATAPLLQIAALPWPGHQPALNTPHWAAWPSLAQPGRSYRLTLTLTLPRLIQATLKLDHWH